MSVTTEAELVAYIEQAKADAIADISRNSDMHQSDS